MCTYEASRNWNKTVEELFSCTASSARSYAQLLLLLMFLLLLLPLSFLLLNELQVNVSNDRRCKVAADVGDAHFCDDIRNLRFVYTRLSRQIQGRTDESEESVVSSSPL